MLIFYERYGKIIFLCYNKSKKLLDVGTFVFVHPFKETNQESYLILF